MPRPRTRTDSLAADIASAAVELVREQGAEALTTRAVAARAGSNIAALGQLFGGREGLIDAVALRGFAQLVELLPADGDDSRATLVACAEAYRHFAAEEPALVDVMFARPLRGPIPADHVVHRCRTILVDAFGAAGGDPDQVAAVALGFGSLLEGLAINERHGLLGRTPEVRELVWGNAIGSYLEGATTVIGATAS